MLLEMIPDIPECAEDFCYGTRCRIASISWHRISRRATSRSKAYESADEHIRVEFDNITGAMTSILTAVGAAMREVRQDKTRARLAEQATGWGKPLVALAGGIINGGAEADVDYIMTH